MQTMESKHKPLRSKGLKILTALGLILLMAAPATWAVGTPSGTTINNTATIDYSVLGADQPDITSTVASFLVDNRVDLTVASSGNTNVAASQTNAALAFTVTNTGNTTQGYRLTAVSGTTNIPMITPVAIYIEEGTTPGFQIGQDTLYVANTNAGDLNPNTATPSDAQMTVYIVADAPAGAVAGNTDTWWLRATTTNAGTATITPNHDTDADVAGTVQNVWADGDAGGGGDALNDGQHAANGDFVVVAAALTVTKTSTVLRDPILGNTNPKAIPGAYVRYVISIANAAGAATATLTTLSDVLQGEITFEPDLRDGTDTPESGAGIGFRVEAPAGRGWGGPRYFTTASDADGLEYNGTDTVSAAFGTVLPAEAGYAVGELRANETVTIQFNVVVD